MSPILSRRLGKLLDFVRNVCPFCDLIIVVGSNCYLSCFLTTIYCCQVFLSSEDFCIYQSGPSLAEPKWRWNRSRVQSALADSRRFSNTKGLDFYSLMFIIFKNYFLSRFSFSLIAKLCLFSNPAKPDAERVLFNRHPRDRARGARLSNQEEVICVPKPTLYIFCTCNDLN